MTTMELIERGIGHNCLSDAYELGRSDAFKTIDEYKVLTKSDKVFIVNDEWVKSATAQIRADVIDECAKAYGRVEVFGCEDCKHFDDNVHCWECIAEQLKEQKNE